PAPAATPQQSAAAVPVQPTRPVNAEETREQLKKVMQQYPPSLREVLQNDPSLLSNSDYLATYPALAAFIASHPEVVHNPAYFFGTPNSGSWSRTPELEVVHAWVRAFEGLQVVAVVGTFVGAILWLIRQVVDYRRWLRLSRVQYEVHTKLMDRM